MAEPLGKETYAGYAIQDAQGSHNVSYAYLPFYAESLQPQHNWVVLNYADKNDYQSKYFSAGRWVTGDLTVPLIPGATANLITAIMTRDGDNQGKWLSFLLDCNQTVKKLTDVKVASASFEFRASEEAKVTLSLVGLLYETGSATGGSPNTGTPYIFQQSDWKVGYAGVSYATQGSDAASKALTIDVDTGLDDPANGMRLRSSYYPAKLRNLSGPRVTATFERDYTDNNLWTDFVAGTEFDMYYKLTSGSLSVTFITPRCIYESSGMNAPGTADAETPESYTVRALGSIDGQTGPLSLA